MSLDPNDLPYDVWRANHSAALVLKRTLDARRAMRADALVSYYFMTETERAALAASDAKALRVRLGDDEITDDEASALREVVAGADPMQLAPDEARRILADLRRAFEEDEHTDFRDGGCTCACAVKRSADGRLVNTGDCQCERIKSVDMTDDGRWLIEREPCTPKENIMTTKTKTIDTASTRIDADDDPTERAIAEGRAKHESAVAIAARVRAAFRTDAAAVPDDYDPVAKARAARDKRMAEAWKTNRNGGNGS